MTKMLEGVVIAVDEEEAEEKFNQDEYVRNFRFAPEQRAVEMTEITEQEYEETRQYCEGR